ncbi:uncharacterized protein FIESC28_09604 [Fusarium coffeatum]|uniref:Ecp2 effector protein domain-containing protein n=1 Tax=Fusarium coffeatum TaxID=231269 RepID=A0A366R128_9HYPO|nr:uncharacterized protein FIESC28_09604 [Fusarium coffeatum]RBR10218.1 hypothetical protein FIESC28_09604 [Fusarium coffeatum]
MHYPALVSAFLASVAVAVPLEDNPFPGATRWTAKYQVQPGDVIVPIKDTAYVVKEEEYLAKLKAKGIKIGAPTRDESWLPYDSWRTKHTKPWGNSTDHEEEKRDGCDSTFYITTDKTESFVDWDVQMSPVVCAVGDMDISVSSGYNVANSVGGSAGADLGFVKDKLGASLGIDYSKTWTTLTSVVTKGTIKDGNCGVMITKPITTRRSGRQFQGCIGSATEIGTWYADSHEEGSYNGIKWVEGAISVCAKPGSNPPLSLCNGQGNFR